MNDRDHKVLESYLNTLDRSLLKLPTSDRAEIIIEIKGHVLDIMEREDGRSLDSILSSLGSPKNVANKYLEERGMSSVSSSKISFAKWFVIGLFGISIMLLIFDDGQERVSKKSESKSKIEFSISSHETKSVQTIAPEMSFKLKFNNGKINIENTESGTISWDCQIEQSKDPIITDTESELILDLSDSNGVSCEVKLPVVNSFVLEGVNGKIYYEYPRVDSNIILSNGEIDFEIADDAQYEHNMRVGAGVIKGFPDSVSGGIRLNVDLGNGVIEAY